MKKKPTKNPSDKIEEALVQLLDSRQGDNKASALLGDKDITSRQRQLISKEPIGQQGSNLESFEVVVAYNLDWPYRYAQENYWLEVLATTQIQALEAATLWLSEIGQGWEITSLVRKSSIHEKSRGTFRGEPLLIAWNLPISRNTPAGAMVRDPVSGLRVGFLADAETQHSCALFDGRDGEFGLVLRKPVKESGVVCWVPLVEEVKRS